MNAKSDKGIGLLDEEEPPPPYSYGDIDLSAEFSNLNLSTTSSKFPSEDECIAHLQLLEAFYQLKEDIVSSDGLFGIHDDLLLDGISNETGQEILKRKREKRWVIFVSKAVKRFQIWFQNQIQPSAPMFTLSEMAELNYRDIATSVRPLEMTADRLPPLGKFDGVPRFNC